MRLPLVLFLALVAHADDPATPPGAVPVDGADAPEPAPQDVKPAASQVLTQATTALVERRFLDALNIAIPAISAYPDHRESLEAVARIATDQLSRTQAPAQPATVPAGTGPTHTATPPSTQPVRPPPPGTGNPPPTTPLDELGPAPPPPSIDTMAHRTRDKRGGLQVGFDLGAPSGIRVEWKTKGSGIDSFGVRVGENFFVYNGGVFLNPDVMVYADFVPATWQVEVSTGASFYYGSPYPMVGVAAQYDPPEAFQANIGMRVGRYLSISPDIGVSFVW